MTPLIIGASGLIGSYLFQNFKQIDKATIGTYRRESKPEMVQFDLRCSGLADLPIRPGNDHIAIICAAETNIAYINDNPASSHSTNVKATGKLMREFHQAGIPIIYVSSDNVFRGDTGSYLDTSERLPVSEYGVQKAHAEDLLLEITSGDCAIVRLAKVVGNAKDSTSILYDIYRQLNSGNRVRAATDLIFNPTYIADTVKMFAGLLEHQQKGVFNFCNPEVYSRYDLTILVAEQLAMKQPNVDAISFLEIDASGKRPLNTTMVNSKIFADFKFTTIKQCIEKFKCEWD